MAWTRYDLWDPWIVKKTNTYSDRYAVVDMKQYKPIYVSRYHYQAQEYMHTLHGDYTIMEYNGLRPNGVQ